MAGRALSAVSSAVGAGAASFGSLGGCARATVASTAAGARSSASTSISPQLAPGLHEVRGVEQGPVPGGDTSWLSSIGMSIASPFATAGRVVAGLIGSAPELQDASAAAGATAVRPTTTRPDGGYGRGLPCLRRGGAETGAQELSPAQFAAGDCLRGGAARGRRRARSLDGEAVAEADAGAPQARAVSPAAPRVRAAAAALGSGSASSLGLLHVHRGSAADALATPVGRRRMIDFRDESSASESTQAGQGGLPAPRALVYVGKRPLTETPWSDTLKALGQEHVGVRLVPLVGGEEGAVAETLDFGPAAGGDFKLFAACRGEIRRDCPSFKAPSSAPDGADFAFVGETWRTAEEVRQFNESYTQRYQLGVSDCRDYSAALISFLTGREIKPARVAAYVEAYKPTVRPAQTEAVEEPTSSFAESPALSATDGKDSGSDAAGDAVRWVRDAAAAMRRSLSATSISGLGSIPTGSSAVQPRLRARPRLGGLATALVSSTTTAARGTTIM